MIRCEGCQHIYYYFPNKCEYCHGSNFSYSDEIILKQQKQKPLFTKEESKLLYESWLTRSNKKRYKT
jgi:hypothetical protein